MYCLQRGFGLRVIGCCCFFFYDGALQHTELVTHTQLEVTGRVERSAWNAVCSVGFVLMVGQCKQIQHEPDEGM